MNETNKKLKEALLIANKQLMFKETGEEEHTFSPEFERRIEELKERFFENGKYVGDKYAKPRRSLVIMRRIAACLCVLVLSTAMVVTIRAYGGEVVDWIVSVTQKDTKIRFEPLDGVVVPETIEKEYVLSEVPKGYCLEKQSRNGFFVMSKYISGSDNYLSFYQYCYSYVNSALDTENANVSDISVNGNRGFLVEKDDKISIVWENGEYCFTIHSVGDFSCDDLNRLAESVIDPIEY